jgi:HEAT repeat protein
LNQDPHRLTLPSRLREERGKPISFNLFGTDISCLIILHPVAKSRAPAVHIHESPSYSDLVNAPYVEVVEKLQANPYFYPIGDIVQGWTHANLDTTGVLIEALDRQVDRELHPRPVTALDTLELPAETFPDLDAHFAAAAQQNTVEELGRLKDPRAIGLLERLLFHPDRQTRIHAVLALGQFDAPSIPPIMTRVAEADSDKTVRDTAASVLNKFSTH